MVQGRPIVGARPGREEAGGSTWWRVEAEEGAGRRGGLPSRRRRQRRAFEGRPPRTTCLKAALPAPRAATAKEKAAAPEEPNKVQRRWGVLGRGLGVLSCKRSNGVVEQSMVGLAKLPELHPRDA
ncbi:hypothetical protein ZWY2020_035304 [Hordeum vulgare]|nr:hypothetical protein ZWY2020_035304 [Hordeum vulgare]